MGIPDEEIKSDLKEFILNKLLPGEAPSFLTDQTPLLAQGILDSISVLQLVAYMEKRFKIKLRASDMADRHLSTISTLAKLVRSRIGKEGP